jgi:Phosphatidylethanolamine-binding protein
MLEMRPTRTVKDRCACRGGVLHISFVIMISFIVSMMEIMYTDDYTDVARSFIFPVVSAHKSSHNKHSEKRSSSTFSIYSSAFNDGDHLPDQYACSHVDNVKVEGDSPPLAWKNPPDGTEQYLLMMWSVDDSSSTRDDWVVYDIDSKYTSVDMNGSEDIGKFGGTSPNNPDYFYHSPCSQGCGYR